MNIDAIVWSAILLSLLTGGLGYWIAYQTQRAKVLDNLKKIIRNMKCSELCFISTDLK